MTHQPDLAFFQGEALCYLYDVDIARYNTDPVVMANTEIRLMEEFETGSVGSSISLRGVAEAFGSTIQYYPDRFPSLKEPAVSDVKEIAGLKVPSPVKSARLWTTLEALHFLRSRVAPGVSVSITIPGPFTTAMNIVGAENLLRWSRKYPAEIKGLMELVTEATNQLIEEAKDLDISFGFADPFSSTTVISARQYQEFSKPYIQVNIQKIRELTGQRPVLHICGKSREIWQDIAELGIKTFSVDNVEDLGDLKRSMGEKVGIMGNVPPVEVLMLGSFEEIDRAIRSCILKGWDSPMGYTLCTGCDIAPGTPKENINFYLKRSREILSQPLDMEALSKGLP